MSRDFGIEQFITFFVVLLLNEEAMCAWSLQWIAGRTFLEERIGDLILWLWHTTEISFFIESHCPLERLLIFIHLDICWLFHHWEAFFWSVIGRLIEFDFFHLFKLEPSFCLEQWIGRWSSWWIKEELLFFRCLFKWRWFICCE